MVKAFIFDRDGVIIDSESTNVISAVKAFEELGIILTKHEKRLIIGRHPIDFCKDFKFKFPYKKFIELKRKRYYEMLKDVELFKKTINFIKKLHKLKIALALTTSSSEKSTLMILKQAKLDKIFDVVVTFEDYSKRKPDPEPYLVTANKLNIAPEDCVVIEDSEVGVKAAKRAGMKCIAIPNKCTKDQDFSAADLVVKSADEIDINMF